MFSNVPWLHYVSLVLSKVFYQEPNQHQEHKPHLCPLFNAVVPLSPGLIWFGHLSPEKLRKVLFSSIAQ